jgi:hypothetical protein
MDIEGVNYGAALDGYLGLFRSAYHCAFFAPARLFDK